MRIEGVLSSAFDHCSDVVVMNNAASHCPCDRWIVHANGSISTVTDSTSQQIEGEPADLFSARRCKTAHVESTPQRFDLILHCKDGSTALAPTVA